MTSVGTQMWHIEALGLNCDYVCLSPVVTKVVCWTGVQSMQVLVAGISNLAWTAVVWPPPSLLSNFFYWQKQPCTVNIVKLWIRWTSLMSPWWVRMVKKNPLHSCKYSLCLRIKSLCFELLDFSGFFWILSKFVDKFVCICRCFAHPYGSMGHCLLVVAGSCRRGVSLEGTLKYWDRSEAATI